MRNATSGDPTACDQAVKHSGTTPFANASEVPGMQRKIIHCDCDCFYAAIEVRDRPDLAGRPVAVGGTPDKRGVIATCNYEARRFGVHSAMPSNQAVRACPDLVLLRPDMEKYREVSASVFAIFRRFTDTVEPMSLDEAFLDVTGSDLLRGSATLIARAIRNSVRRELGITVSAGIAPNKFLAKVASDWNKPDGQFVVRPQDVDAFVAALPVRRLPGVGPAMTARLAEIGVTICADLRAIDAVKLHLHCGNAAQRLRQLAIGEDRREVQPRSGRKSVSVEQTFAEDKPTLKACQHALTELEVRLRQRLAKVDPNEQIRSCFVKVRFNDFTTTTAERASAEPDAGVYAELLASAFERAGRPVRLLGVGVSFRNRNAPSEQLELEWSGRPVEPAERRDSMPPPSSAPE